MKKLQEYFTPTRFAAMQSWKACVVFIALISLILFGIIFCKNSVPEYKDTKGTFAGDSAAYLTVLERVRAGEGYYKVFGEELRSRNYGVRPFFNWKLPTLTFLLASMPSPQVARWLLILITAITLILWLKILAKKGGFIMAGFAALLLSGVAACSITPQGFVFYEIWAGVLIALSIAAYQYNRPVSIASGLAALFIRELALPFALIMLFMAYKDKRPKEVIAWLVGIFAFFIYLAVHAKIVSAFIAGADPKSVSWLQLGGWKFVLSTARWSLATNRTPWWANSIILPLSILGLYGWPGKIGSRTFLTLSAYIGAFLIVGRADNYYWGLMYTPLMPLGLANAPPCLVDLYKAVFKKHP
jgi:hypothetical protein